MAKIKKFFSNKLNLGLTIGGAILLATVILLAILLPGRADAPSGDLTGCTIEVKSAGGKVLEGVCMYIYKDAAMTDMIDYVKTDAQGIAAISRSIPVGSVAVLDKVPAGYVAQETYSITTEETKIVLQIKLQEEMVQLALGDVMFDFTVTDTNGTEHTLSKLLETKKAVVINLWYANCGPCKAEFPYLKQAYNNYSDNIEILAINPEGDSEDAIADFVAEHDLSFPTAKGDAVWKDAIATLAYPTTIIIDRFGTVGLIHIGGIDSTKVFEDAFAYFVADDYVQSTVEKITDVATDDVPADAGTKEHPQEFAGVTEFEITVAPGEDYYCNVYRVSGMVLKVESESLKLTYGETVCRSEAGVVKLQMPATTEPSNPFTLCFTNTGAEEETYQVTFAYPEGARENPLALELGEMRVEVAEGNAQGVYLTYTAEQSGKLTLMGLKKNSGYNVALYNLTATVQKTLEEDAVEAGGETVLFVPVAKGDEIQVLVASNADDEGNYSAASVSFIASVEQEEKNPTENTQGSSGNTGSTGSNQGGSEGNTGTSAGPNTNGTLVNPDAPVEQYGFVDFSIEVGAGEKKLVYMIRTINEATLCIQDKDAYVVYKGVTYTPVNGAIYIPVKSDGSFTPMELEIGNSGSAQKTFQVLFYFAEGSRENPITLNTGENKVQCAAGNDQGTFYTFKAAKAGTLTLEIKGINPSTVVCGININDMQQIPTVVELEEGSTSLSIDLPAGAEAEIIFTIKDPNKEWKIPAAEITINVTFA